MMATARMSVSRVMVSEPSWRASMSTPSSPVIFVRRVVPLRIFTNTSE